MVEILQRGITADNVTYTAPCRGCRSLLRFTGAEATRVHDRRDGDYLSIECPVCQGQVTVTPQAPRKPFDPEQRLGGFGTMFF